MNKKQDVANAWLPNIIRFITQVVLWKSVSYRLLSSGWFTSSAVQALIKCWLCGGFSQLHLLCIHSGVVGPDFTSSDFSLPLCCTMAFLLHWRRAFSSQPLAFMTQVLLTPVPPFRFCWYLWMGSDLKQSGRGRQRHTDNVVAQVLFPLETRQNKKFSQREIPLKIEILSKNTHFTSIFLLFSYLNPWCPIWIKYISNPAYTVLFC